MGKEYKKVSSDITLMLLVKGVDVLTPLILIPYLIRTLGLDGYGVVAFLLAFATYFSAIISYGFNVVGSRDVARIRDDSEKVSSYVSTVLCIQSSLLLISLVLSLAIATLIPSLSDSLLIVALATIHVASQAMSPAWLFLGLQKVAPFSLINASCKIAFFISVFLFVNNNQDVLLLIALYALFSVLAFILGFVYLNRKLDIHFSSQDLSSMKDMLRWGYPSFIMQVAPVIYNNSSIFLVGLLSSAAMTGVFSAAQRVIESLIAIARIVSNVLTPYISTNLTLHRGFSCLAITSSVLLSAVIFLSSELIMIDIFEIKIIESVSILKWLSLSFVFAVIFLIYGVNYLIVVGDDIYVSSATLYISVLSAIASIFLIFNFGIFGAVFSILLSRFFLASTIVMRYFHIRNKKIGGYV